MAEQQGRGFSGRDGRVWSALPVAVSVEQRASLPSIIVPRDCVPHNRFLVSKGRGKSHAHVTRGLLGIIAETTGTDRHRAIGRPLHVFHLKIAALAEAICSSTRKTQPLHHY